MATYLDEIKNETLYRRKFFLPIYEKDKRHKSLIFLLSNSFMGSYELRNNPFIINANRSFISYYMEPDVKYYMNIRENVLESQIEHIGPGTSNSKYYDMQYDMVLEKEEKHLIIIESDTVEIDRKFKPEFNLSEDTFLMTYYEADQIINEASPYDNKLKTMLYKNRIRSNKQSLLIYKSVKESDKKIEKTFLDINRYKSLNLFVDLYYYNDLFLKNVKMMATKANDMYFKFLYNLITDPRYDNNYIEKSIFIPVKISEYGNSIKKNSYVWDHNVNINVLSAITKAIKTNNPDIRKLDGYTFVFIGNNGYFKTNEISQMRYYKFIELIKKLYNKELIRDVDENRDSPKAIKTQIINTIENSKSIEINNLVGTTTSKKETVARVKGSNITVSSDKGTEQEKKKQLEDDTKEVVDIIDKYAKSSTNVNDVLNNLNGSEYDAEIFKNMVKKIENSSSNRVKINATRSARMNDLNNKFLEKKVRNMTVEELIHNSQTNTPLPQTKLEIDSVNEEWKDLRGVNFEKIYSLDEDIVSILYSLKDTSYPISILDVNMEDTSTSEDHIYTYTVKCEDSFGSRFTLKFDIPKFRNDRYMKLKGNDKILNGQLLLLPVIKTDEDTVQIVTSYKKIFIRRYGESAGKSTPQADAIMKALEKYKGDKVKIIYGDNRRIASKYDLPIDYLDLSKVYSKITVKSAGVKYDFYFNQDEIREKYTIDETKGIPYGVMNDKNVLYYDGNGMMTTVLHSALSVSDSQLNDLLENATRRKKYVYSRASILNAQIPLIVVMAYSEGLTMALDKAKVDYELFEKRPKKNPTKDIIKFKDGFLQYTIDYDSSLLLNGLKDCDTENYSIGDINDKEMWVDFLDLFGGRLKADGLDNFYDLTMDPITVDICKAYDLPTDYIELLAYANSLLADNKYNKHVDITGNRYRTNEQIASLFYESLSEAYEQYKLQIKNGRNKPSMSMKQSVVIDKLMEQPTFSDLSIFSPLLEVEAANAVSFKGKSGMNNDRSYGLDKRIYDKSMTNVLALSTGFAANVGLTRQMTIDKNISGKRGLIKESGPDEMNTTKSLSISEALTPFGSTHDDPFRSAMTFIQTSKHSMRTKKQSPLLITNGADEALPYLCSDMYAFKAKYKGKVAEITKDYMIIDYGEGVKDFIDLRENIKKNSDGGVFEVLKLDTDLKVGATVKEGQVVAYDKKSFVTNTGSGNLATSVGILSKVAILETDEGYEDSAIISNRLSENLMSEVVIQKPVLLAASTNVYKMVKKGAKINVGDTLLVIQNAFDDEDANILLKNITDEELVSSAGRIPIKSKITGVVQDIKIYRSCELEDMSESLRKVVSSYESEIRKLKKASKDSIDNAASNLEPDYKLQPTGKLKNAPDSVLIEFYLKYDDKMSVGDKVVYYSALKGVCKDIFPDGKEPRSQFRPDEQIDTMLSVESINARMVGSIINTGCINKILIELGRKSREIMGLPQIDEFE